MSVCETPRDPRGVDLRRLRAYLAPLTVPAAIVVVLSAAVGAVFQRASPQQVVLDNLDPDRQAALARRIVRVESEILPHGEVASSSEIGVLLGQSTIREGVDEKVVGRQTGLRWLNLGASGGSFVQLAYYSRPLLASRLRPRMVVVGVHVEWLASTEEKAQRARLEGGGPLARLWFWRERNTLRNLAGFQIGAVRQAWLAGWGQPLATQIVPGRGEGFSDDGPPSEDAWTAPRKYLTPRAPDHRIDQILEHVAGYGWFSAAAYDPKGTEARALAGLCTDLTAFAPVVVLVLMPEELSLRAAIPKVAHDVFARVVLEDRLVVLDHRAVMDDSPGSFYDPAHLNAQGREHYSERLGRVLVPILDRLR